MSNRRYKYRKDTSDIPFEYQGKQLVFSHYDGTFYCYNIINADGNFRGVHQSNTQIH